MLLELPETDRSAAGPDQAPQLWPRTARWRGGRLQVGGVDIPTLASLCGTPLYVIDEQDVRERARAWRAQVDRVHYASKAFLCTEMVRWVQEEDLHLDVSSGNELALARASGMDAARIVFHGNNKSTEELRDAVDHRVGVVVVDCTEEIDRLADISARAGRVQDVYVRVTPDLVADTHAYMATGGDDVKFGFPIKGGYAEAAVLRVESRASLRLRGIHSHLGSQVLDLAGPREGARRVAAFVALLAERHDIAVTDLDLGGGAGIAYLPGQEPLEPAAFVGALRAGVAAEIDPDRVHLAVEPGRAIIGSAGITVYRIGVVKDRARRRFVSVDGGMSDAIRPSLYGAEYSAWVASRELAGDPVTTTVVGKHCETGDVVVPSVDLPSDIAPGDLLAVPATGAYHLPMASNYNLVARPAVVSVRDGHASTLIRRETPEDVFARDLGAVAIELGEPA